jgi:hypothetical protein
MSAAVVPAISPTHLRDQLIRDLARELDAAESKYERYVELMEQGVPEEEFPDASSHLLESEEHLFHAVTIRNQLEEALLGQ